MSTAPLSLGERVLPLYLGIMEEIKVRIGQIGRVTAGDIPLPPRAIQEFCLLQVRMVCELIALACLHAHGDDVTDSSKLAKEWQAGRIVSTLGRLHRLFPVPVTMSPTSDPKGWHFTPVESGYLSKSELLELYGNCGRELHRGSLKNLLNPSSFPAPMDFATIDVWVNKIYALLDKHQVRLASGNVVIVCIMQTAENAVQVAVAAVPDRKAPIA